MRVPPTRRGGPLMPLPDFVIVGAMRSGTSSLARWLRDHPQVFMPARKELHFFDSDETDLARYTEQFTPQPDQVVSGEATPSYMFLPEARERMAAALPSATFLVLLRDPVERAYSHYWHERERGEETKSFERALELEDSRLARGGDAVPAYSYQARGRYHEQLVALEALVGRERIHVSFFEELTADPERVFAGVCDVLGVDRILPDRVGTQVNAFTTLRSKRLHTWSMRRPPLVQKIVGRLNRVDSGYPPMSPSARQHLRTTFQDSDEALRTWLGRDLPW